ncbi:hypothetical protein GCM10010360_12720 [Streptomyces nogalater]
MSYTKALSTLPWARAHEPDQYTQRPTARRSPTWQPDAGARPVVHPAFLHKELRQHLAWFAEKGPDGLVFVGEKGAPFRRTSFGRKWRRARAAAGIPAHRQLAAACGADVVRGPTSGPDNK